MYTSLLSTNNLLSLAFPDIHLIDRMADPGKEPFLSVLLSSHKQTPSFKEGESLLIENIFSLCRSSCFLRWNKEQSNIS